MIVIMCSIRLGLINVALGDQHRKQRKVLNPVFSIAHMRRMIPIFTRIGHKVPRPYSRQLAISVTSHYSSKMLLKRLLLGTQVLQKSTCSPGWAAPLLNSSVKQAWATPSTR